MDTKILKTNSDGYDTASKILQSGGLVAFPTETVYGLGADALNNNAVSKIYSQKTPNFQSSYCSCFKSRNSTKICNF